VYNGSFPLAIPIKKKIVAITNASFVMKNTNNRISFCNEVSPYLGLELNRAIVPIKVSSPVLITTPYAAPSKQRQLLKPIFFASKYSSLLCSTDISMGSYSPVQLDYSTVRPRLQTILTSATIFNKINLNNI
jgi:hypothetical protein